MPITNMTAQPEVLKAHHRVCAENISPNALTVLNHLNDNGFEAYLVGGGVRDLLLDITPKDFDIATNALPNEIKRLFPNCRLIGRRFRLAHIYYGKEIIEVATFRGPADEEGDHSLHPETGMIMRDNCYGQLQDDVWRRDFTVNALYFNLQDNTVIDYTNGLKDLENKSLRLIGNPVERYKEDPVRMLRAVRLSVKLGLTIEEETSKPISRLAHLFTNVSNSRLFEELLKLLLAGFAKETYYSLLNYELLEFLLPLTLGSAENHPKFEAMIDLALVNTDKRIAVGKPINPAFLLAVFLWQPFEDEREALMEQGQSYNEARNNAFTRILKEQTLSVAIPRRFVEMIKQIWDIHTRLIRPKQKAVARLIGHKRFRAAYDFLLLRSESGETQLDSWAKWWTDYQEVDEQTQEQMVKKLRNKPPHKKNNRRKPNKTDKKPHAKRNGQADNK